MTERRYNLLFNYSQGSRCIKRLVCVHLSTAATILKLTKGGFNMSNKHKYPTISFRVSEYERNHIEARIKASGMKKKDYFVRSCIYNRICAVGKKETIYPLVYELSTLHNYSVEMYNAFLQYCTSEKASLPTSEEITKLQEDYTNLLKAVVVLLDGAQYLWKGDTHE